MKIDRKVYRLQPGERERVIEKLTAVLAQQPDILFVYVFGSFAEGLPFHDIDVGVYLAQTDAQTYTESALSLADTLSMEVAMPVDVRVLNAAPVPFLYHVLRGRLIVDRDPETRARITEETLARFLDIKRRLRHAIREAFSP